MTPPVAIDLWFDFSCPYAYLASRQAPALAARLGVPLTFRPMLLGGVFRGIGAGDGPMATLSAVRADYNRRDMHRWAERFAAPLTIPPAHPMRTVRALRVLLGLPEARWPAAIAAIYAAYWERGEDVTQDAVLSAALGADDEVRAAIAGADAAAIKDELRRRTDEAIALGIFGAPAWVLRRGDARTLIWGQDRLAWIEAVVRGWDPDAADGAPPPGRTVHATPGQRAPLEFYFDVASPFAYLGLAQLRAAGRDPGLTLRPILLGGLFRAIGTVDVPLLAFPPAKRAYVLAEMARWARWHGVPFRWPSRFPQRTVTAQRLVTIAPPAAQLDLALALAGAMWTEDRDLADEDTLATILAAQRLPAELLAQARAPDAKARLAETTERAAVAGVFGVPSYVVDGHVVWGQDRAELAEAMRAGWRPANG